MTEGVTASLLVIAAWLASRARITALGITVGVMTLVRPQMLVLAPLLGLAAGATKRIGRALLVVGIGLAVCAPGRFRNWARMGRCGLSFNAG